MSYGPASLIRPIVLSILLLMLVAAAAGCGSETASPQASPVSPATGTPTTPTAGVPATPASAAPTPVATVGREEAASQPTSRPGGTLPPATPTAATSPETRATVPASTRRSVAPAEPAPTLDPTSTALPTPSISLVSHSFETRNNAPSVTGEEMSALADGNSRFAFDLYATLAGTDGNLFFSPHSISVALAMTYAGARGETERQMAETLRFYLAQDRLHEAFNALDLSLVPQEPAAEPEEDEKTFRLSIANSVWGQEDYDFLPDFLDTLAVNYGDGVRPVDFQHDPENARVQINDWVAEATEERISNLIPQDAIDQYTRMVLANAIYFKAAWQHTFDERATTDLPFHLPDGSERDVPMMRQQANFRYAIGDGYQAVELPYKGGDVAMTILLPDTGRFREFEESLSGESLGDILDSLDYTSVRLTMPKFEMESAFNLSDTLKAMGMPDAFDDTAANFSGMDGQLCRARGDICLLISNVLHKAFVSVDEAGTEAAAATAVIVGVTRAVFQPEPIQLVVDRPFLFIIRHQKTGAILFVGRVLSP